MTPTIRRTSRLLALLLLLLTLLIPACKRGKGGFQVDEEDIHIFPGVHGPETTSALPERKKTSWKKYEQGGTSRLAILLTEPDSPWLGLAQGFKSHGIPFLITDDYKKALKHRVVLVYPYITGRNLKPEALRAIAAHPRDGGTLMACNVLGGGLHETFGFKEALETPEKVVNFQTNQPPLQMFKDPKEKSVRLEKDQKATEYTQPRYPPLALYGNGQAAITQKPFEKGRAYAFGVDLGQYILRGYNARQESTARSFDNQYEPSVDVWIRLVGAIYRQGEPDAVTIGTVPGDKEISVLMTHDVDFTESMTNAVDYAKYEKENKIPATFFIQVKYIRDWNDDIFFNDEGVESLKQVAAAGLEVGSHTIAHSKVFDRFDMGTGEETYPDYQPFVKEALVAHGASILGELRVSKFLIERLVPGTEVTSFRPGELSYPYTLPEALLATGFKASSSTTANNCLTHLPFQLRYGRGLDSEVDIFEFPVTIEDEAPPDMGKRVDAALDVARKLRAYGGLMVILIHPNITGHKLQFEKDFIKAVRPYAHLDTVRDFAAWWGARNEVTVDVHAGAGRAVRLDLQTRKPITNLTLLVPKSWKLEAGQKGLSLRDGRLMLARLDGKRSLQLRR